MKRFILMILVGWHSMLLSQAVDPRLRALADMGFEDVMSYKGADGKMTYSFEAGNYRFLPRAINDLFKKGIFKDDTVQLVINKRSIPVLFVELNNNQPVAVEWPSSGYQVKKNGKVLNPTAGKLDIPFGIDYGYQLGNFDRPLLMAIHATAGIDLTITRGLSLQGAVAFPLFNNFDSNTFIRPHRLAIVYDRQLPDHLWLSASLGFFTQYRAGGHIKWRKYTSDGTFFYEMNLGYTRFSSFTGKPQFVQLEPEASFVYLLDVGYQWKKYDLGFLLSAGRYLYQDAGVNFSFYRQFNEKRIGIQLLWTENGKNGGFFLQWPFLAKKYPGKGRVSIQTMRSFPISYRYTGNDRAGRTYQTGDHVTDQLWETIPYFFSKNLLDAMPSK